MTIFHSNYNITQHNNSYYCINQGNLVFFWKSLEIQNNQKFSEKLKEFINKMLEAKKNNVNLDDIMKAKNDWFINNESLNNDNYMKNIFKQLEEKNENF